MALRSRTAGGLNPSSGKNFSHVSTAPIEYTEANIGDLSGVHIVTGAQLGVWDFGAKNVLYLKLLFSKVPGCTIRRSVWDHSPSTPATPMRSHGASSSSKTRTSQDNKKEDSSANAGKLAKVVDLTEMSEGPQDIPGHWLVTGAKLGVDKGRIVLRIKYSLLNYWSVLGRVSLLQTTNKSGAFFCTEFMCSFLLSSYIVHLFSFIAIFSCWLSEAFSYSHVLVVFITVVLVRRQGLCC